MGKSLSMILLLLMAMAMAVLIMDQMEIIDVFGDQEQAAVQIPPAPGVEEGAVRQGVIPDATPSAEESAPMPDEQAAAGQAPAADQVAEAASDQGAASEPMETDAAAASQEQDPVATESVDTAQAEPADSAADGSGQGVQERDLMNGEQEQAASPEPEPEPEPVIVEPEPEPEPEPVAAEPEPEPEPEPVVVEPEPEPEPEPVVAEPEPEPEPVVAEPEPELEPVVVEPEPEPEPEPVVAEPEPAPEQQEVAMADEQTPAYEPSAPSGRLMLDMPPSRGAPGDDVDQQAFVPEATDNSVTRLDVALDGGAVVITIATQQPVERYEYFPMGNHGRLVVDLYGAFSVPRPPSVPDNALVTGLRVGQHGYMLRIVADLKVEPPLDVRAQESADSTFVFTLRPAQ